MAASQSLDQLRRLDIHWSLARVIAAHPDGPPPGISEKKWRYMHRQFRRGCRSKLGLADGEIDAALRANAITRQ